MYKEHPNCKTPDGSISIWRYMDFAKFVDLLQRKKLHFARLDQLGDPFEGAFVESTIALIESVEPGLGDASRRGIIFYNRAWHHVNCWHMNDHESLAMWRLYSQGGIAIRSTVQRLADCFETSHIDVFIGEVAYRDRHNPPVASDSHAFATLFSKGMSYQYELELRAVAQTDKPLHSWGDGEPCVYEDGSAEPYSMYIDVDLSVLIEKVYISPGRPQWFKELVRDVIPKYGISVPTEISSLEDRPDLA